MENSLLRIAGTTFVRRMKIHKIEVNATNQSLLARYYSEETEPRSGNRKTIHPYKNIHPWKSVDKFAKELVDNVIYNKDGLVVLNKPYGISSNRGNFKRDPKWESINSIPNATDYTMTDAIARVAEKLGYANLLLVKSPEKFISGITLFATDEKIANAANRSIARALPAQVLTKTYWIVTSKRPKEKTGSNRLAISLQESPCKTVKQPVILSKWTKAAVERGEVKRLNVDHRILSNSTQNLCSLVEMKCSTTKWHAIRVYASTILHSPVLGDNIHGSRVQTVMGNSLNVSPFVETAGRPQKLQKELLEILDLSPGQDDMVPVHIHLREMKLISFLGRGKDLTLEAPLPPSFLWTCEKLKMKIVVESEEFPPEKYVTQASSL